MLLTTLAEAVTAHLNSSPERWAGDLEVEAKTELDPSKMMLQELGVYVMPQFVDYSMEISGARGAPQALVNILHISLVVSKVFEELPIDVGVANWSEAKVIQDVRQRAEIWILQFATPKLTLMGVDANALEEIELDNRNFVALTTFSFQQSSCATEDLLPA
jgi:hypothetical protein